MSRPAVIFVAVCLSVFCVSNELSASNHCEYTLTFGVRDSFSPEEFDPPDLEVPQSCGIVYLTIRNDRRYNHSSNNIGWALARTAYLERLWEEGSRVYVDHVHATISEGLIAAVPTVIHGQGEMRIALDLSVLDPNDDYLFFELGSYRIYGPGDYRSIGRFVITK